MQNKKMLTLQSHAMQSPIGTKQLQNQHAKAIVHRQPKRDKLPPCQIKSDSTSFNLFQCILAFLIVIFF